MRTRGKEARREKGDLGIEREKIMKAASSFPIRTLAALNQLLLESSTLFPPGPGDLSWKIDRDLPDPSFYSSVNSRQEKKNIGRTKKNRNIRKIKKT